PLLVTYIRQIPRRRCLRHPPMLNRENSPAKNLARYKGNNRLYCGPVGFMTAVEGLLDALNVPLADRYSEAFAPDPSFVTELANT
ncbi:MAG: hypothetical protein ABI380_04845, partial [Edaphobacter sp.]